jgi:iron complex outermembrane receptor protein
VQKIRKVVLKMYFRIMTLVIYCLVCTPLLAKSNAIIIPEVNLKPKKSISLKSDARIQTSHFNRTQITNSPVASLTQLFQQEQSIVRMNNSSGDSSQTALSLRGFGDNAAANSLILVDGFPLTNPSLLAPNFNAIPLSDIESISITHGSQGTLWGDQAVGGVIHIVTKHPRNFFADSIVSAGSFNKMYANVLSGNKFKNGLFLKAYGTGSKGNNYRQHNQQADENFLGQGGLDYAKGTLVLTLQFDSNTNNFPGGLSETQYNHNPRQATNFTNYSHYNTQIIQLLNKQEMNDHWVLETRVVHQETKGNGFVFANFYRDDSENSIRPRLSGIIHDNKVIFGYDGQSSSYRLAQRQVHSYASSTQQNLYLQTVIPLTTKIDFTLGGRGAIQSNRIEGIPASVIYSDNRVFVSEQGISIHPKKELSFFLRRDGNFSFPKANEQTLVPANVKSLDIQTGTSYEVGGEWLTENLRSQINLYRLDLHNEIAFNPQQTHAEPFGAFNNLDRTIRYGITLTEFYRFTPRLNINSQWNYVNARFKAGMNAGKLIPAIPAITGNIGLDYSFSSHWQARYALLYTGSRIASEDVTNSGKNVPGYWLHDIAIQYVIKPIIVSFEITNLLNQPFSTYTYYNPVSKSNTYYPGTGRSYLLTLKVNID